MNNLFILHTQYNLIIGSGIALENKDDFNALVLYPEFAVTEDMLVSLRRVFNTVIVLRDGFENEKYGFQEIKEIRRYLKKTAELNKYEFDRIFLSQERRFDTLLAYKFYKKKQATIIDVEEDAYYSLKVNTKASKPKRTLKNKVNELLRSVLIGKNPFYEYGITCYGSAKMYDSVCVLFPDIVREEISGKKLIEVTSQTLINGIDSLYSERKCDYPEGDKYFVIFFDLIERYKDKERALEIIRRYVSEKLSLGYKVLAKYHPRETEKFTDMSGVYEIDKLIPGEKVLADLLGKDVTVFGNATAVCTIAAKFGYNVLSIAKLDHPENALMHSAMEKMGISLV